jgi:hypothetical protein
VLGLLRLARGPTVIDRIMAFDLITTSAVGMTVLLAIQWRTALDLELILIFSRLGFFGYRGVRVLSEPNPRPRFTDRKPTPQRPRSDFR